MCREPVKIDGGVSIEVILATEKELNKVLRIANRNIHKYPNAIPDVKKDILEIQNKIESNNEKTQEQLSEIRNLIMKSNDKTILENPIETLPTNVPKSTDRNSKKKEYKRTLGTGKCSECNVKISNRAKRCLKCFERPKKFDITKEELHDLIIIKDTPYEELGRKYGVSGNTIRKRCKSFDIELPKRQKLRR